MSRRDAALILGMVAWTRHRLKAIEDRAKTEVDVRFPEEKLCATVDDVVVSSTSRVQPSPKLRVEDEVRFAEWVRERWPEEIVPAVSEAFRGELLRRMQDHPEGVLEDASGEVCMWVELSDATPYTATRLAKGGADRIEPLLVGKSLVDLLDAIENEAPVELGEAS
jgi:hypothetical protein